MKQPELFEHTKICSNPDCPQDNPQPICEFYGKSPKCKTCEKKAARTWRENNLERKRAKDREWYRNNREGKKQKARQYYWGNRGSQLEYRRQYRQENYDEMRKRDQRWYVKNRRKKIASNRRMWHQKWMTCIELAGGVCQVCGEMPHRVCMEFHHVDRKTKTKQGGRAVDQLDFNELDKCALVCRNCHGKIESSYFETTWRKRDGLGYELVEIIEFPSEDSDEMAFSIPADKIPSNGSHSNWVIQKVLPNLI